MAQAQLTNIEEDPDVTIVSNVAGIEGGIALWRDRGARSSRNIVVT